ncbi:hypothetical protein [Paraburkholderia bannensis]|uniref:hypothetical protein n=1 Tax=Paraburkholderia bannensis TaxID=765414 RepID=UPI002AC35899|nr:hypothetical protein [Paraburkholderia bannensis]
MMERSSSTVQRWGKRAPRAATAATFGAEAGKILQSALQAAYSATAAPALLAAQMPKAFENLEGLCAKPLVLYGLTADLIHPASARQNSIVAFATNVRVAEGIT